MTPRAEAVLAEALRLTDDERGQIADRLLDTLAGPADPDVQQAWADEIARRLAEVRAGTADTVPWEEARRQIFGDGHGDDG